MISGIKTLGYLDQGLGSVRQDINRIDKELNHVSETMLENRRQQAQSLKQLAKTRLDEIAQGSILGELNAADQRAVSLLEERTRAYQKLESDIDGAATTLNQLESDREAALNTANTHAQAIIDCEHKIQANLENDGPYQQQLQETRKIDSIADQAEEKAALAENDRQEKSIPYESNALFIYLWKRKYGTADYSANTLTRYLDNWVEGLCNYNQYRVNYWTLLEIPKRLRSHADGARSNSDQAVEELTAIERDRAQQAGLPELQNGHAQAQQAVDVIDDDIVRQEENLNQLLKQRTQYIEARDSYMEQSLQMLSAALKNKTVYELNDAVHQTVSYQDDMVVRELAELQEQHNDLADELRDHRQMHEAKLDRLQKMESVRRQFKDHRFDDVRSGFGNENLIASMFGQFASGLINSGELWRVLQRHQRHRDVGAWPDFGSGGLGTPKRRNSPWHSPRGRGGSGGSFRLPKSGGWKSRGGGGGFRTGGGF